MPVLTQCTCELYVQISIEIYDKKAYGPLSSDVAEQFLPDFSSYWDFPAIFSFRCNFTSDLDGTVVERAPVMWVSRVRSGERPQFESQTYIFWGDEAAMGRGGDRGDAQRPAC